MYSLVKFAQCCLSLPILCLFVLTALAQGDPVPASSMVSSQKLGSVLVYNFYTSNASDPSLEETDFSLTNTNPTDGVTVHLFFVNAATNQAADTFVELAPRQTQSFLASNMDPGNAGFVVAVAVHATSGCPVSFNYLSGDAYLKLASSHTASLPAVAFAALYSGGLGSCDINSTTAPLDFNGSSYNEAPRALAVDNVLSLGDSNSMRLIVNRLGGSLAFGANAAPLGSNFGLLYDGGTSPYSFTFTGSNAQFRSPLSNTFPRIAGGFSNAVPAGTSGWMKFWPNNDAGVLGAILNFNPNAGTNQMAFTGGHNLRQLTLSLAGTLTIPVYPPTLKADLALSLTHSGNFTIGSTGDYTLTVNNAVMAKPATGTIKITDTLPGNLTLQSFSGAGWNCTGTGTANVVCTNTSGLAAGASLPTLTLTVNIGAGTPASITNTATVSVAPQQESNLTNNSASDTIAGCITNPIVTNNNDSGAGSLRQAIVDACVSSTITFAGGVSGTITLTSGELVINKNLTIQGPGASLLSISGNNSSRVFSIGTSNPATNPNVTIDGVTVSGGNLAFPASGGGIFINAGTLTLTNSTVSNNTAGHSGGGIYNRAALTIMNSAVANNSAANVSGGGIYNFGTLSILKSTISGNVALYSGGGIADENTVIVTNSTLSGNQTYNYGGGGIVTTGMVTLTNTTISGNDGGWQRSGGGLYVGNGGTLNAKNSIVSKNTASLGPDVFGNLTSQGYNLIGNNSGVTIVPTTGDQIGTLANPIDPLLGALANNGGPTQTMALLPGSPAIDKGSAASGVMTDQRGLTRPIDFSFIANATGGDGSDIGAFEAQTLPNTPPTITTVSPLMRQQGSAATNLQIATISDADQTATTLTVTAAQATGSGVTVSNITINAVGQVFADVAAGCNTARSATFRLTVSDNQSATAMATLTVNVTDNTPPTLTYSNQTVVEGGSLTINPATGPSDNGSVISIVAQSNVSVNNVSGVVSMTNVRPAGFTYMIIIRATDNCGAVTDASFTVTVTCPVITINPSTLPAGLTGVPYSQSLSTAGGSSAVTYSLNNGSVLPSWLTLSAAGILSGTPPQAGNAAFTIKATDSNGCTGLRSYALSWAFVVGGTPVTTVGQAQLSLGSNGSVIVSGLNNPGLNGYTLQLGQATGAGVTLQPAADLRPNGNSIATQIRGQVNGVAGQVISTSSFAGNGVNVIYTEDFSGIGSTQSLFQFYDATGNLLRAFTALNLSQLTFNTGGSPYTATAKTYFESRSNTTKTSLDAPVSVIGPANITTPNVTEISVMALHPTATVNHVSSATVLGHLNQGTLAASHPTVGVFGLPFQSAHPLLPGETQTATLSAEIGGLTVSNIGSSGLDGVVLPIQAKIANPNFPQIHSEPIFIVAFKKTDPPATPTAGAFMQASATGTVNAIPNQSLGMLKTTKNQTPLITINSIQSNLIQSKSRQFLSASLSSTSDTYTVTASFGVIPSTTHRVQVYNNGALVADLSGHTGAVTTSSWPLSFAQRIVAIAGNPLVGLPSFITTYPANTGINISGNNYVGNELRVTAEGSGGRIDDLTEFKLTAADIPEFTIVDAQIILTDNPPTISAVAVTRQAGSPAANSTIANVNDIEDAENILNLKVNNAASATVNGVTISGLSVNSAGAVMANVVAACGATNASFALTVTDSGGTPISASFDVTVTANTPPSLVYPTSITVSNGVNGVGQTISPTVRSDNGTITSFTLLSDLKPGDLSVNQATGVVKVEKPLQPGPHPVTITATDNCGAIRAFTFLLIVNRPPSINGTLTTRQKGSLPSLSVIAVVGDAEDAANTLNLQVNNAASATVNGITVSGLSVDSAGSVRANVVAACISSTAIFTLMVTDSSGLSSSANLTVGVSPNTPPILGTYLSTTISLLTGTSSVQVTPIGLPPSDNGTISNMTVAAPGVPGNNLSVNPTTGVVRITKAGMPTGTFNVTVTAIDNCGAMTTRQFQLIVKF